MAFIRIYSIFVVVVGLLSACGAGQGVSLRQVTFKRPYSGTISATASSPKSMTVYLNVQNATDRVDLWLEDDQTQRVTPVIRSDAVTIGDNQLNLPLIDSNDHPLPPGEYILRMKAFTDDGTLHGAASCKITYLGSKPQSQPAIPCQGQ